MRTRALTVALLLSCVCGFSQDRRQVFFFSKSVSGGGGTTNLMTNLVAYWTMDENIASGTRADSTANAENLTDVNNNVPSATLHAALNRDLSLNGAVGPMAHTSDANLTLGGTSQSFSFSLWVYPNAIGTFLLIDKGAFNFTGDEFVIEIPNSANFKFVVGNGTTSANITSAAISTLTLYHLVCVYDNPAQKLHMYINGVEDVNSPVTWAGGTQTLPSSRFTVAGRSADNSFIPNCFIDEVGFWKRPLDLAGAQALYGSGTPPSVSTFSTINH